MNIYYRFKPYCHCWVHRNGLEETQKGRRRRFHNKHYGLKKSGYSTDRLGMVLWVL